MKGYYEGVYDKDGRANGYGRFIFTYNPSLYWAYAVYTGGFKDGKFDGYGVFQSYEEPTKKDAKWSKGTLSFEGTFWDFRLIKSPKNENNVGKDMSKYCNALP